MPERQNIGCNPFNVLLTTHHYDLFARVNKLLRYALTCANNCKYGNVPFDSSAQFLPEVHTDRPGNDRYDGI